MATSSQTALLLAAVAAVGSAPALAGDLSVTVLDGGLDRPMPLAGATAEVATSTSTTTANGVAALTGIADGYQVVRITGPEGYATVEVRADATGSAELLVLLPHTPSSIADVVTLSAGSVAAATNVEDDLLANARLELPLGTVVGGAADDYPMIALHSVDSALTPTAFPGELQPRRMWTIQPAGLTFGTSAISGGTLRLPNEECLAAGTTQDLWTYDAEQGTWVKLGTMTVDSGGDYLESESGIVTQSGYFALDTKSPLVHAEFSLSLTGPSGTALSGATVTLHGQELAEVTSGTYSTTAWVTTGTPVRAFVTTTLSTTLRLSAMTRPTLAVPFTTALNQGEALSMKLTAVSAQSVSVGFGNTSLSGSGYEATHVYGPATAAPVTTTGTYVSASGPLEDAYPSAKPHKPLVQFTVTPIGSSIAPNTSRYLPFILKISDADLTTRGKLVSVAFTLDGGTDGFPHSATILPGDLGPYRAPECGGNEYLFVWDRLAPPPSGSYGDREVALRVTFEDEPSGQQVTVDSDAFWVTYPEPLAVVRHDPQAGIADVYTDTLVLIDFDQPLDASTVNSTNFTVKNGASPLTLSGVALLSSSQVQLSPPTSGWPTSTTLTVEISTSVQGESGATLTSTESFEFTTGALAALLDDDQDGMLNVEEIELGIYGGPSDDDDFDNDGVSDFDELFKLGTDPTRADTDGDGINDLNDVTPNDPSSTPGDEPAPDVASLGSFSVVQIAPAGNATVTTDTKITVTFSNPYDVATVTSANLTLTNTTANPDVGVDLSISATPNAHTLVLAPNSALSVATDYEIRVEPGGVADLSSSSQPLAILAITSFTTGSIPVQNEFEATHYMKSLSLVQWESFPLTSATAGGRNGSAQVVPSTGQLLLSETDVAIQGRGLPVAISRVYRSNSEAGAGIFGPNWHFPYDQRFEAIASVNTDSHYDFEFRSGDGRLFEYLSSGNTTIREYVTPTGFYEAIREVDVDLDGAGPLGTLKYLRRRTGDGTMFFYAFLDGSGNHLDPSNLTVGDVGYLMAIQDRNANRVLITRDSDHLITEITDDTGRTTTLAYGSGSEAGLVQSIEQFKEMTSGKRAWTYDYDANGCLWTVTTPAVADFNGPGSGTAGKTTTYTYTQSGSTWQLSSLKDGRGNTTLRVFYDHDDNVCQVDYACDDVSGTALYTYDRDNASGRNVATEIDRSGNVSILEHASGVSPYFTISKNDVLTRGAHPFLVGAEPPRYTTLLGHNDQTELVQHVDPNGNVVNIVRGMKKECSNCKELVFKSADYTTLLSDPDAGMEDDRVWKFVYEPFFHLPFAVVEPRGNDPDFVSGSLTGAEDPFVSGDAGCRSWFPNDPRDVEPYTTRFWYDHMAIEDWLTVLNLEWPGLADVDPIPESFGRTGSNDYHDPTTTYTVGPGPFNKLAFPDADGDGKPDRGGNPVAVVGPAPLVADCLPVGGGSYSPTAQHIQVSHSYNEQGQRYLTQEPDGKRNRVEFKDGSFDATTNVQAGFPTKTVLVTPYDGEGDLTPSTGLPDPGGPNSTESATIAAEATFNAFGNTLTTKSPRGFTTSYEVNSLNLVTKVTAPTPFAYTTENFYDANNNLVETRIQNQVAIDSDDDGLQGGASEQIVVAEKPTFDHRYTYNSANLLTEQDLDAYGSTPNRLVTSYAYNCRLLRVATREPAGNVHLWRYDERNLVYEEVLGSSDATTCQTIRYDYDPEGKLLQVLDDDGNFDAQVKYTYDAFDRLTRQEDELGNYLTFGYDVANHMTQRKAYDDGDNLLENTVFSYDRSGRVFQVARELWDPVTTLASMGHTRLLPRVDHDSTSFQEVMGSEFVYTLIGYDQESKVVEVCDDNAHKTTYSYDTVDRLQTVTDHLGSSVSYAYDTASNVVRITESELPSDNPMATPLIYYTEKFYDELNRLVATTSHMGNTTRYLYDSRHNIIQASDAMGQVLSSRVDDLPYKSQHPGLFPFGTAIGTSSFTNERGNTTRFEYDGVSRRLSTHEDLRVGGVGGGQVINTLTTSTAYDGNSRVESRIDPRGNVTGYVYDHQNRQIREVFADGTDCRYTYNRNGTLAIKVDPRGVAKRFEYDALERKTDLSVQGLPAGQEQTTFASWDYDGLSRITKAEDNDTILDFAYDSMSRQKSEVLQIATGAGRTSKLGSLSSAIQGKTSRAYDGVGNLRELFYPQNHTAGGLPTVGNPINRAYDGVDRLSSVTQGATTIASFRHIGMGGRCLERKYNDEGVTCTTSFDYERRFLTLDTIRDSDSQRLVGYSYTWDRADNRRQENRLAGVADQTSLGDFYVYDSAYRLVHVDVDVASTSLPATNNVASVTPPVPNPSTSIDYHLDASGNRTEVHTFGTIEPYLLETGAPTYDAAMNQYTQVGEKVRSHDKAGNVTQADTAGVQRFYDCDNRLVQWTDGTRDVRYRYDAQGRRVLKKDESSTFSTVLYYYDDWQCIEERTDSGNLNKTYVFGGGVDEVLRATLPDVRDLDGDSSTSDTVDLYYHHNSIGSVMAVTYAGAMVESYRYKPYGEVTIFEHDKTNEDSRTIASSTVVEQPFMFTGRRWDFEEASGLYFFRHRYLDPATGRFIQRDPLGIWTGDQNRGGAQNYAGNNPVNWLDPFGLTTEKTFTSGLTKGWSDGIDVVAQIQGLVDLFNAARTGQLTKGQVASILWEALKEMGIAKLASAAAKKLAGPCFIAYLLTKAIGVASIKAAFAWGSRSYTFGKALGEELAAAFLEITCAATLAGLGKAIDKVRDSVKGRKGAKNTEFDHNSRKSRDQAESDRDSHQKTRTKRGCFLAGTLVLTSRGKKRIEDLQVGDLVLSQSDQTGEQAFRRVARLFTGRTNLVLILKIVPVRQRGRTERHSQNHKQGGNSEEDDESDSAPRLYLEYQVIRSTPGHPYFVSGRGWLQARDLRPGDMLVAASGSPLEVASVDMRREHAQHFNIEVEGWHTYFVAQSEDAPGVWVHNLGCKVEYGEHDLSKEALEYRRREGVENPSLLKGKRNVAVFEYEGPDGTVKKRAYASYRSPGGQETVHAEIAGRNWLRQNNIDPNNVKRIYSEYDFCKKNCDPWMQAEFPNAKYSHSFDYNVSPANRQVARQTKEDAILGALGKDASQ